MTLFKKQNVATFSLIAAVASSVVGCGGVSTKKGGEKAREIDNGLSGEWQDGCVKLDWLGLKYARDVLKFSVAGDFDRVTTVFNEEGCAAPSTTLSEHGTYASLGSASVPNATDINFTITEVTVTPESDAAVTMLNTFSYCGIGNWQKGQAMDVVDHACLGKDYPKGTVSFDIYRLENSNKRLTLGKASWLLDKSDAGARPAKLDDTRLFDKQ